MNLGFIGLGAMGSAIAKNLAAAGHQIKAWNRSGVELDGITRVATVEDVFDADVVFTMLSDDAAIRAVLLDKGTLTKAKPGTIHIVCSTISVAFSQELMAVHFGGGPPLLAPHGGRALPEAAIAAPIELQLATQ